MFARYQDILAGQVDEDGQGINNVGKALERIGINIRDAEGGFKDFSDVLDELYPKWGQLSEVEQANITKALAGVRQRESLLVLLENETKYRKALTETMNAEGLASERYATYLDSVEAAQNRVTASWESLVMSTATSDMVKNFYDSTAGALDFVNALGGIPTILKIVIPLVVLFNAELIKTKILATGEVVSGLATGLKMLIPSLTGTTVAAQGTTASLMAANVAALPFVLTVGAIAAALVYATAKTIEFKEAQDEIRTAYQNSQKDIEATATSYDEYVFVAKKAAEAAGYMVDEQGRAYAEGYHGAKVYVSGIDLLTESQWNAVHVGEVLAKQLAGEKDYYEESIEAIDYKKQEIDALAQSYVGFSDTLKLLSDDLDTVDSLIEKSMKGELDFTDLNKIPEEYLSALTVEGDKLKINISLIKEKQLAEAEMSYQAAQAAYQRGEATAQEVEVIKFYYDSLLKETQATYGAFEQTSWAYDELLWRIANDAAQSGQAFYDMEGQALSSADAIYSFMASGNENFGAFVQQIAVITGKTVADVMNEINSMISTTSQNAYALENSLRGMSGQAYGGGGSYDPLRYAMPTLSSGSRGTIAPSNFSLFTGVSRPSGYSGSGGSGSSRPEREDSISNRQEESVSLEDQINEARENAINDLEEQLDLYEEIIDARKKILDTMADEREYQRDVEDKNKEILKVQTELNSLQFDNSEEANARRLELQEELSNLNRDLEDIHYEESVEDQKDALDAEFASFEETIRQAINQIEGIQATSVQDFANQLASIMSSVTGALKGESNPRDMTPTFHDGAKSGVVGKGSGMSLKSNELFAKLLAGEVVSTPSQIENFMSKTLPQIANGTSSNIGGDVKIEMPINIAGSLDKSVMPDLNNLVEKVLERIQTIMNQRGYNRRADLFQI